MVSVLGVGLGTDISAPLKVVAHYVGWTDL